MKYAAIIISSLAAGAFAIPQASSVTAAPSAASAALTPQQSCAVACPAGDVDCQAKCLGIAHPNSSQASETNECAAKCDQGDGSPAATEKFSQCVQGCIASFFPTSQTAGVPAAGSNAPSAAASATGAAASAASGASRAASGTGAEATGTSSASGSAASASSTGAASSNNIQLTGAGIAGLFMALFAL
ncbi:hypothetical protein K469DRAFT_704817 [Zopfia rhizophila CBS 207.26]|uniref:Extracellular membrane protein CFEM domain-containing protein n=1 Tax=Zopfia rhizophila CBS 207.26 TaxID=1314779 RepID=A0A6A6E9X9_9PEZI|nr:hypothetical protein K469DRAFT_704817 [Zopfia rhizophila CBS 207.26]